MTNEKFTLTWHSYANHFQEVLGNLLDTGAVSVFGPQNPSKAMKSGLTIMERMTPIK